MYFANRRNDTRTPMDHSSPPVGLWTISGPSGAGKTTLCKSLMRAFPQANILLRVTTRDRRETDIAKEYEYLELAVFWQQDRDGRFATVYPVHDYFHAAPADTLNAALSHGQLTLADVSPDVVEMFVAYAARVGKEGPVRSIYLDIRDEGEIARRLIERRQDRVDERIAQCRGWLETVRKSAVPFHIIDARASREEVLREALKFFLNT